MTKTIRVLSELTINQIAAGEVIENPASVVKELVENAIDAGSSHITVETLAGGFQGIKISDNGSGMSPEDAVLCLERHSTSKIFLAEDLFKLNTMGFRGEALASIASISKLQLLTSADGERATSVSVEAGKILHIEAAARAKGTTIDLHSLFYNVPARKKFQKSPAASSAEITKVMTQLSLAHPHVGMTLIQQNRTIFSTLAEEKQTLLYQIKERAAELLPPDFVASCKEFHLTSPHCSATGLIADPAFARQNRSGQYLFINQRPVSCPCISFTIKDAYGTRISSDKHPVYLIHFSIPPDLIDINVHPQKKEVRLREESLLKYVLHEAINSTLMGGESSSFSLPKQPPFFNAPTLYQDEPALILREEMPFENNSPFLFEMPLGLIGIYKDYLIVDAKTLPLSFLKEQKEGLVFFHLKSVQRRIFFEQLIEEANHKPLSQGLLFPLSFSCSLAEAQTLHLEQPLLSQLGLSVEQAGKTTFLINAIPPFLKESQIQDTLSEIVASQKNGSSADLRKIAILLSRRATHSSTGYTLEIARHLIGKLIKTKDPHHCPEGMPTWRFTKESEIENPFKTFLSHAD